MTTSSRPLKVFLCHAHSDKDAVLALYRRLVKDGVDAWLDKEKLLPGQDWELEIRKAVRESEVVVVCLSKQFNQAGFRQKEVRLALDTAMEQPEGEIFIIPARLDECDTLESLRKWHWVDLFEPDGYEYLMRALRKRAEKIGVVVQVHKGWLPRATAPHPVNEKSVAKKQPIAVEKLAEKKETAPPPQATESAKPKPPGKAEIPLRANLPIRIIGAGFLILLMAIVVLINWEAIGPIFHAIVGSTPTTTPTATPTRTAVPTFTSVATQVSEKDGMVTVYVPSGEFRMGSETGDSDEQPVHTVYLDAYWIDRTEVTNAMYALCVVDGACQPPVGSNSYTHPNYYGTSEFNDYPVIYVNWTMANDFCTWAGRRLPTEAEWEKAARGTDERTYPWRDDAPNANLLNYNWNVGDTTLIGTYPNGASPYGALDMAGNVAEWVSDWFSKDYYMSSPSSNPLGPNTGLYRVLRGGSWYDIGSYVRTAIRNRDNPFTSNNFIGFRCARDANPYSRPPATATITISEIFTPTLTPSTFSTWTSPKDGMVMVNVPLGEFRMGSASGDSDEQPVHAVYLDAYWIDRTEVTNAMYALCVADGACQPLDNSSSYTHSSYYLNPEFNDYPVIYVNWNMASTYCEWRGARLPTEAEWEKAARGTDEWTYPWGNTLPGCLQTNYWGATYGCVGDTSTVGSYPSGASPYGALDMAGNVAEWVSDWFSQTYYGSSPSSNPLGPNTGAYRVLRGGAWNLNDSDIRSANRGWDVPTLINLSVGFRCARDATP